MTTPRRPDPPPLPTDDVRTVVVGTVLWVVVGVVLAVVGRGWLADHDASWWLAVPPIGAALGLLGIWYCARRAAAIARDAARGIPQRE